MKTLAIIPAKRRSVGVPDKNWKPIDPEGRNCVTLAQSIAAGTCDNAVISSDAPMEWSRIQIGDYVVRTITRPPDLPDTMLAVVQHALAQVPGPDDEIIVLLQPSSPLRTAETVKKAIAMLREGGVGDSVVSVSPSYPHEWSLAVDDDGELVTTSGHALSSLPGRRQDCAKTYRRDGVVYAFRRDSVTDSIYGHWALPLYTPPDESLSIDTEADWAEAVRRLKERHENHR